MSSKPPLKESEEMVVPAEAEGKRLDLFLAEALGLSRRYLRRLLERDHVRVGGLRAAKGATLRAGDRIEIAPFHHPDLGPRPTPELEIRVLVEHEGLIAVDKPAGLPTHPLDFEERETVMNGLLARYPDMGGVGEAGLRSGVVHRLDTFTSGVLLFARRQSRWEEARSAFRARKVDKRYLARVHGQLDADLELVLRLDHRGKRMRVVRSAGRESVTQVHPLRSLGSSSLVEVRPITGLMHQIRAVLSHLGHPVLGDRLYGSELDLGRHLLHATFIRALDIEATSAVPEIFYRP